MQRYAAIFYDVENLLKGYNASQNYLNSISLKEIFLEIKSRGDIERIAVQRAYANWSDSRLSIMKGEINELGIDPIQIFGFSRYQKKNAADIQLAVDAMDIAYIRPLIDVFVIVSGDGGFSSLAKKLHEYGKSVIGCAYESSTNKIFASVCDVFIGINEPEETDIETSSIDVTLKITNPKVLRMSSQIDRLVSEDKNEIIKHSKGIIQWFIKDPETSKDLAKDGIFLSVVKEAFKYGINNFDPALLGFAKFVNFLQFICTNTDIMVLNSAKFEVKLAFRNTVINGFNVLPDLDDNYLHSVDNYKSILAQNPPRMRISNFNDLRIIAVGISRLVQLNHTLDSLLEYINELNVNLDNESVNGCIFTLIHSDIFIRQPEESPLSEQILTLKDEYHNPDLIITKVQQMMYKKLSSFWGDSFKDDIFKALISE
ncbi:NYN domain-containing protein [Aphanothece sacrum]|uniref:NYN domain protein n=1 Tax=Aphanothece sacrum FPU1 TaxID=1920663 RepID=A0A401IK72_APHSA|nr:NYN domain-containing protein [Aphanothece sacrum]GBF81698.1 NYN domain protein [Aphanothece sacrum FPU1]GBF85056.1 hypothetical protein AsFPU3_2112 [Aphanothece sacrum FPU3]